MIAENRTLTDEMRDEMFMYAVEVINENSFSENNWTKLHEKDRFYNWYHGYTEIRSPYLDFCLDYNDCLAIDIKTSATSGVFTTQYYGKKFQPLLVERKLGYLVTVEYPKSVTLNFKLEKVSMTGLAIGLAVLIELK